ncbi:alpha/beta hydrolase [Nocardia sp. NPDC052316]|uniref:alpha/beta hydrolase n=1 Tax=Nocardia sp. NPDC052316 TaxID=3364329 RepID=UPI0037C8FAB4
MISHSAPGEAPSATSAFPDRRRGRSPVRAGARGALRTARSQSALRGDHEPRIQRRGVCRDARSGVYRGRPQPRSEATKKVIGSLFCVADQSPRYVAANCSTKVRSAVSVGHCRRKWARAYLLGGNPCTSEVVTSYLVEGTMPEHDTTCRAGRWPGVRVPELEARDRRTHPSTVPDDRAFACQCVADSRWARPVDLPSARTGASVCGPSTIKLRSAGSRPPLSNSS